MNTKWMGPTAVLSFLATVSTVSAQNVQADAPMSVTPGVAVNRGGSEATGEISHFDNSEGAATASNPLS